MKKYEPIAYCSYGPLAEKVNLEPDFFTGFHPEKRHEIVTKEAEFYHSITASHSVDDKIKKEYIQVEARDEYKIPVKIYTPNTANDLLPAFIFIHGGGFMTCSVETHDFVPSYITANAKVKAFSIEYRLAPEHKFPQGLNDCYDVICWISQHAKELNIDSSHIIVGGDSSGGNFTAALTLMSKTLNNFKIDKQILIYPALDFSDKIPKKSPEIYAMVGSTDGSPSPMLISYLNNVNEEILNPLVSPLLAENLFELPPALFIEAECDALLDDGLIYAKLLQDSGVPVSYHIFKGMPHAFILRTYEETFEALNIICQFINNGNS